MLPIEPNELPVLTLRVCVAEVAHEFAAETLIVPLEPAVALIVFVVLVPLHPPGNVHE